MEFAECIGAKEVSFESPAPRRSKTRGSEMNHDDGDNDRRNPYEYGDDSLSVLI
jgi:hypothetical protein